MTRQDSNKILDLIAILCPRNKKYIDKKFAAAWMLALAPYEYEAVKKAVVHYSRHKNFFPDVSELIALIPSSQPAVENIRDDFERMQRLLNKLRKMPDSKDPIAPFRCVLNNKTLEDIG